VEHRGLKKRFLRKHRIFVDRFYKRLSGDFGGGAATIKIIERLQKNRNTMFTFLDFDDVPWNNNNAEHAIKRFAKYRRDAGGRFTERTLQEYLVLASVFETCEFNNVNVLKFLLSRETTLEGLLNSAGRRAEMSREVRVNHDSKLNHTVSGSTF
ncbi:MAG: transposase, partial [Candidatus Acidiferrum sp.]